MKSNVSRRSFLKKSGAALLMPGLAPIFSFANNPHARVSGNTNTNSSMLAGFAEMDITPEIGMEQPGGYGKSFHKTLHDPCKVRAAVFDDGVKTIAIAGVDTLMIPRHLVLSIRKKVQERCGIPADAVLIGASHSHSSGPLGMIQPGQFDHADTFVQILAYEKSSCANPRYISLVEKNVVEAICNAYESRKESQAGTGIGLEDKVAFNRRFRMKNGITYTHPRQGNPDIIEPAGPIDPEVGVIGAWDKEGNCMGCIVNYACHCTTNPGGISANWVYYLEQTIRGAMGPQCVVVFVAGASGDVTQVDNLSPYLNPSGEEWARFVGGRVGAEAVKVLLSMPRGKLIPVNARNTIIKFQRRKPDPEHVRKSYELVRQSMEKVGSTDWTFAKEIVLLDAILKKEPAIDVEVQALQVGPAIFVTNPAEYFCQLGLDVKSQSPFEYTFPVSLANGCVGYVPTEEAFGPNGGGYETRLTSYSNLEITAGTKIAEAGIKLAKQMVPGPMPEFPKAPPYTGTPWLYGNVKPELK